MLPNNISVDKFLRSRLIRLQEQADNLTYSLDETFGTEFEEIMVSLKTIEHEIERIEHKLG